MGVICFGSSKRTGKERKTIFYLKIILVLCLFAQKMQFSPSSGGDLFPFGPSTCNRSLIQIAPLINWTITIHLLDLQTINRFENTKM